jgi:hypothetical protein
LKYILNLLYRPSYQTTLKYLAMTCKQATGRDTARVHAAANDYSEYLGTRTSRTRM